MLVTMKEILVRASKDNYAVAAPNVYCELDARAVIEAAEELRSPLILDVAIPCTVDMKFFITYLIELARQSNVPIAINQDHGETFADAIHSIRSGVTSIMVDRSSLPYKDNLEQVKELTKIAHAIGISVEAELGHVGQGSQYSIDRNAALTDPAMAKDFVECTGVDCLAVAIGTAHGAYSGTPYLDYDRLTEIKKTLGYDFPLVLHGGSGTGLEAIGKACRMGINKVNVANDMTKAATVEIVEANLSGNGYYNIWNLAKAGVKKKITEYIKTVGSEGKAWIPEISGLPLRETIMSEK